MRIESGQEEDPGLAGTQRPAPKPAGSMADSGLCGKRGWRTAHLEEALVVAPGRGPHMLQQRALMREGEVEGQVARVLPVAHLAQEVRRALRPLRRVRALPRLAPLHLRSAAPQRQAACTLGDDRLKEAMQAAGAPFQSLA